MRPLRPREAAVEARLEGADVDVVEGGGAGPRPHRAGAVGAAGDELHGAGGLDVAEPESGARAEVDGLDAVGGEARQPVAGGDRARAKASPSPAITPPSTAGDVGTGASSKWPAGRPGPPPLRRAPSRTRPRARPGRRRPRPAPPRPPRPRWPAPAPRRRRRHSRWPHRRRTPRPRCSRPARAGGAEAGHHHAPVAADAVGGGGVVGEADLGLAQLLDDDHASRGATGGQGALDHLLGRAQAPVGKIGWAHGAVTAVTAVTATTRPGR